MPPTLNAVGPRPAAPARAVRHHEEFPLGQLLRDKGSQTVSVCIPARDEAATVAEVVRQLNVLVDAGLVDEVIVMDHASVDGTAAAAAAVGARVVDAATVLSEHGPPEGKGDVLWRSLDAARGDIVVWLDADLTSMGPHYVTGLLGPLLEDPYVVMVRATYTRHLDGVAGEGGRVTELLARPLISLLFPDLAHVRQPLGGEYAIRRSVARRLAFERDYGVEMGLLLDVAAAYGVDALAQVDLGHREHRNRSVADLREQSRQVLRACLTRAVPAAGLGAGPVSRPPLDEDETIAV